MGKESLPHGLTAGGLGVVVFPCCLSEADKSSQKLQECFYSARPNFLSSSDQREHVLGMVLGCGPIGISMLQTSSGPSMLCMYLETKSETGNLTTVCFKCLLAILPSSFHLWESPMHLPIRFCPKFLVVLKVWFTKQPFTISCSGLEFFMWILNGLWLWWWW